MPSWTTQRRKARQRDGDQCQICGDILGAPYCQLQVHHIRARAEGGADDLGNLVVLCDLCHAVCHWHMGPAWCGVSKLPCDQQDEAKTKLTQAQQEFRDFLALPLSERDAIQAKMWERWGIAPKREV
jgi:hypothetical protein